jgi:hypothetical protein
MACGEGGMNAAEASDLKRAISANYPEAVVKVRPSEAGADIVIAVAGDKDRKFKIENDYLRSPIVRLLIGGVVNPPVKTPVKRRRARTPASA